MKDNPYAAPNAAVADRPRTPLAVERPRQVTIAVVLLWLDFLIALPLLYQSIQREPDVELVVMILVATCLFLAIFATSIVFAYRGRNWARIVLLMFVFLTAIAVFLPSEVDTPVEFFEIVLDYLSIVLELAALYLLFAKPGALWFRAEE